MFGSPFIPVGLFIYGWTAQNEVHYIVPLFGTLIVGIGYVNNIRAVSPAWKTRKLTDFAVCRTIHRFNDFYVLSRTACICAKVNDRSLPIR